MSRQSYTKNIQNLNEVNWSNLSKLISGTVIKQFLLNWLDSVANGLLSDGETTIEQAITELQNASGSGGDTFFKGYYATEATLNAVYETGSNGYYAIVGETDTFWVWDSDSNMWVNSGSNSISITIDASPISDSSNAVSSGGVYTVLAKKADKVTDAVKGNVASLDEEGNLKDSGVAADGLLNASNVDVSDIETGESKILTVEKQSDGTAAIGSAISQLDKLGSSVLDDLLAETADWDGDEITITGDNTSGALGENGQEYYIDSDFFLCISHSTGTDETNGTATWRRNRGQDCLTEGLTQDDLIIAELQYSDDWSDADFKTITSKSKKGTWWRDTTGGYLYMCISTSNGWTRVGTPDTTTLEITSTSHPTLTTSLAAHTWTTLYLEGTDTSDEDAEQGQEYWDETNNTVYKRNMNGYWAKIFG
jgi:hypothetical protein